MWSNLAATRINALLPSGNAPPRGQFHFALFGDHLRGFYPGRRRGLR
jgi:hypothetical protein